MGEGLDLGRARFLVTGGAGFIGSNFVHHVRRRFPGSHVTVLDKLTYAGNLANLESVQGDPRYHFVKGDICDGPTVAEAMAGCDVVVNFAAETHVDRSIDHAEDFVLTDTYGVWVLLEEARRSKIRRFLQISTDEVYGEILTGMADEQAPLLARNPYAASKIGGDRLAYSYFATHGTPTIVTRCSNNYGPSSRTRSRIGRSRSTETGGTRATGSTSRTTAARWSRFSRRRTSWERPSTSPAGTSGRCSTSRGSS
jgi:dTDP-glucose 4,6-dehydratase